MIGNHRKPSLDLLLVAGITPLLTMTQSALSGFFAGAIIIVLMLLAALLVYLLRPFISQHPKWLVVLLIASVLVGMSDRLLESVLPELHGIYGLYLPLLVVVPICSMVPAESGFGTDLTYGMARMIKSCVFYFTVIFIFGSLREIIVTGSLLSDSGLILGADFSFHLIDWQLALFSRLPGALFLLGLLLAILNRVKTNTGMHVHRA